MENGKGNRGQGLTFDRKTESGKRKVDKNGEWKMENGEWMKAKRWERGAGREFLSNFTYEGDVDGVPDTVTRRLSLERLLQQLTSPLAFTFSFWLDQNADNHKYPKHTDKDNTQPLRKSLKEVTGQANGKNCFINVQEKTRDGFTSPLADQLLSQKLSLLRWASSVKPYEEVDWRLGSSLDICEEARS